MIWGHPYFRKHPHGAMSVATLRVKVARGIATGAAAHALGAACLVASEPEAKQFV